MPGEIIGQENLISAEEIVVANDPGDPFGDPFSDFVEWATEADDKSYGDL